ncbi:hypothetical protein ACJX0J_032832, partial [Zea mays]
HNQVMKHELYISFQVPSSVTLNILSNVWRPRSLGLPVARRSVMAQDDPVVSAQWMHEHLVMPDVKARQIVGSAVLVKARDRPEIEDDEFYSLDLYCQGTYIFAVLKGIIFGFNFGGGDLLQGTTIVDIILH